jgi:hypothetical protein
MSKRKREDVIKDSPLCSGKYLGNRPKTFQESFSAALDITDVNVFPRKNRRCHVFSFMGSSEEDTLPIEYVLEDDLRNLSEDMLLCTVPLSFLKKTISNKEILEETVYFSTIDPQVDAVRFITEDPQAVIHCAECGDSFLMDQHKSEYKQVDHCRLNSLCFSCFSRGLNMAMDNI